MLTAFLQRANNGLSPSKLIGSENAPPPVATAPASGRSPLKTVAADNKQAQPAVPLTPTYTRSPLKPSFLSRGAPPPPPVLLNNDAYTKPTEKDVSTPRLRDKDAEREEARQMFRGAAIYFHTDAAEHVKQLRETLTGLGATIETFLTKSVTLIISNRLDELQQRTEPYDPPKAVPSPLPNAPEPLSSQSVLQPSSPQTLVPVKRNYDQTAVDEFLQRARTFNIKIWSISTLMSYIKRTGKLSSKQDMDLQQSLQHEKTYGLSTNKTPKDDEKYFTHPFIVVSDTDSIYRPFYKEFIPDKHGRRTLPAINFNAAPTMSVFLSDHYFEEQERQRPTCRAKKRSQYEHSKQKFFNMSPSEQVKACRKLGPVNGYCENCNNQFSDIRKHAVDKTHVSIVRSTNHYDAVDELFELLTHPREPHPRSYLSYLYSAEKLEAERRLMESLKHKSTFAGAGDEQVSGSVEHDELPTTLDALPSADVQEMDVDAGPKMMEAKEEADGESSTGQHSPVLVRADQPNAVNSGASSTRVVLMDETSNQSTEAPNAGANDAKLLYASGFVPTTPVEVAREGFLFAEAATITPDTPGTAG